MNNPTSAQTTSTDPAAHTQLEATLSEPINTGYVPIYLQNATGAPIEVGDVLAVDYATGTAFNGSATEAGGIILTWVIAVASIPSGGIGAFGTTGVMYAKVRLLNSATITPGTWLEKDLTTGSLSLQSTGLSLANNNQPGPPNAIAYALQTLTADGVCLVYFPGGPRSDWPSSTWFEFFEDFVLSSGGDSDSGGVVQTAFWDHVWQRIGAAFIPSAIDPTGGIIALDQTSGGDTPRLYTASSLGTFTAFVDPTDCLLEIRYAQKGSGAGTRRVGLWDATPTTSAPTNGIILQHNPNATMRVNIYVGGVLTTFNTGVTQADAEFATWRIQHDSLAGAFLVWRNNVYIGRVVSTVPTGPLGLGFHPDAATGSAYLDFIRVRSRR